MKRIKVKQINNHIWLLNDNDESTGYLVTGSERGLIIDTMTGHNLELVNASFCEVHRKAVWEVCVGIKDKDEPYSYFGGTCMAHPYGKEPRRIVYQER